MQQGLELDGTLGSRGHLLQGELAVSISTACSTRTDLKTVAEEVGRTVEQLNGLNRYRFRKDPDLLAAWEAVRFIGPRVRTGPERPTGGGVTPPAGGIAPAE